MLYSAFEPQLVEDVLRAVALRKGDSSGGKGVRKLAGDMF